MSIFSINNNNVKAVLNKAQEDAKEKERVNEIVSIAKGVYPLSPFLIKHKKTAQPLSYYIEQITQDRHGLDIDLSKVDDMEQLWFVLTHIDGMLWVFTHIEKATDPYVQDMVKFILKGDEYRPSCVSNSLPMLNFKNSSNRRIILVQEVEDYSDPEPNFLEPLLPNEYFIANL